MPQERYYYNAGNLVKFIVLDEPVQHPMKAQLHNYVTNYVTILRVGEVAAEHITLDPPVPISNAMLLLGVGAFDFIDREVYIAETLKRLGIKLADTQDSLSWKDARLGQLKGNAIEGGDIVSGGCDAVGDVKQEPERIIAGFAKGDGSIEVSAYARKPDAWEIRRITAMLRGSGVPFEHDDKDVSGKDVPRNLGDW